jgi:hypothetical protein
MVTGRTVRKPLEGTRIATGFIALKGVIEMLVRTRHHDFEPFPFRVDSGTNITSIPVAAAQQARLPIPKKTVEFEVRTAVGPIHQRVHPGHIAVRIVGFEGRDFVWLCHFVEQEASPPPILLGLTGVVNDLDIRFTGDYALEARYGWVELKERLGQTRSS